MGIAAMLAMRSIQFEQYLVPANHEALHEIWLKTRELLDNVEGRTVELAYPIVSKEPLA